MARTPRRGKGRFSARLLPLALTLALPLAAADRGALPVVRVGVVVDGPGAINRQIEELTVREVLVLTAGEFDVRLPEETYLVGDWTLEGARERLRRLLADPAVDLVVTWGILASHAVCCEHELTKPVIAPVVLDVALQGLPLEGGTSGVENLSYVALPDNLREELLLFREIVPFRHLAFLANRHFLEGIPGLAERSAWVRDELGIEFDYVPVGETAAGALAALPEGVDAVYVWPLFHLSEGERQALFDGLTERRLPTFSGLGREHVEAGLLATAVPEDYLPRLARRVALNLQRILLGEGPGAIPVAFSARGQPVINMATARAIGVSPRWSMLLEAELLHPEPADAPRLTLSAAVERAVAANLDLAARFRSLAASAQDVAAARSELRPRLEAELLGTVIDEERAATSFGTQAERSASAGVALTQLLYSDAARANLEIQRLLQEGRAHELEELRLDTAFRAAVAYLELLRAKTLLEVQRNNLRLTRSNLELARVRRSIGAAASGEVYRWESQTAADRKALVEAAAGVRQAEIALNRLLHRDLETVFVTAEVDLGESSLLADQERFVAYVATPRHFRVLRDFSVAEGLASSPELARLESAVAAQERTLLAARRAYWAPLVAATLSIDELLERGGAGAEPAPGLPAAEDTRWTLALSATLPLWSGGGRTAERLQAEEELAALELQRQATAERIAERIRSAAVATRASFTGIELAGASAAAAAKNLELVADAYARGAVPILDLLDAQNSALNADLNAANALYDFYIDLMEVQRAANQFDFFVSPAMRRGWWSRLDAYYDRAGVEPWPESKR